MTTPHPDPDPQTLSELLRDVAANFPWDAAQRLVDEYGTEPEPAPKLTPAQAKRARKRAHREQPGPPVLATPRRTHTRARREAVEAMRRVAVNRQLGIVVPRPAAPLTPGQVLRLWLRARLRDGLARLLGRQP